MADQSIYRKVRHAIAFICVEILKAQSPVLDHIGDIYFHALATRLKQSLIFIGRNMSTLVQQDIFFIRTCFQVTYVFGRLNQKFGRSTKPFWLT